MTTELPLDDPNFTPVWDRIAELWIYPVKSCAGVRVPQAVLQATGLQWDRHWMVVDALGRFVTQRTHPHMALVQPLLTGDTLRLRASHRPDLGALAVPLHPTSAQRQAMGQRQVQVWKSQLRALDEGEAAAQWFTQALGLPVRLVRFDPTVQRRCSQDWTAPAVAHTEFADGFPLLVTTASSVSLLNHHLQAQGAEAVDMRRFRANIVLAELPPHAEDRLHTLDVLPDGANPESADVAPAVATLRPVKPCTRCPIPDVNPDTGAMGKAVRQALRHYRQDPRVNNGITFGQNAIVLAGAGARLQEGMRVRGTQLRAALATGA